MAAHATAATLLLALPRLVRPAEEVSPEPIKVVFEAAPSTHANPLDPAPPALSNAPAEPEPARQPPITTALPSLPPVSEPVPEAAVANAEIPEAAVPALAPDVPSLVAPAPIDPSSSEDVVPLAPPPSDAAALPTAVAPPSVPPRHPTARHSPSKRAQRQLAPPEPQTAAPSESSSAPSPARLPVAAPSASAVAAAGNPPIIDPGWRGALSAWMQAHRRYPDAARRRGEDGTVGVSFTVSRDGDVLGVQIVRPSGSALLDQSVYDMLAGQKVPALPPGTTQMEVRIMVNVRFSLDR